jgi:hypothetical protein
MEKYRLSKSRQIIYLAVFWQVRQHTQTQAHTYEQGQVKKRHCLAYWFINFILSNFLTFSEYFCVYM